MSEPRAVLGIDPGAAGAAVAIDLESSLLSVFDMPGGKDIPAMEMARWVREQMEGYDPRNVQVGIEMTPEAMPPGMSSTSSMVKLARNAGVWEGIVAGQGFRYARVSPTSWKAAMGLKGKDKRDSLAVAQREFPWAEAYFRRVKDVGRADAALIALYAARRLRL
mgnify:FL=1